MGRFDSIIDKIYQNSLIVLEKKGIFVENETVLKRMEGVGGITRDGSYVRFNSAYTDAFLKVFQQRVPYKEETEFAAFGLGHANHIVDWDDNVRPLTEADNNEMARLCDALADRGIYGSAPGIPQDVPMQLQGISQFVSSAKNSRVAPNSAGYKTLNSELMLLECMKVLGRDYAIGVHLISPLKLSGNEAEIGFAFFERFPSMPVSIGGMPTVGLTTPATIVSGFTVALAEVLGGAMIYDAMGAKDLSMSVNLYPFDMKYTSFVYGTPSNIAINRLEVEINRKLLHTNISSKAFNTMSQLPNQQAAVQKAVGAGIMAEFGKKRFSSAGALSMDEIASPVQYMVDAEILGELKKTCAITDDTFNEDRLLLDVILNDKSGDFIMDPSTMDFYRENQWDTKLFPSFQLQQWIQRGKPEFAANAKELAKKLIRENTFELEAEKARELDKIYDWARAHMNEL